MRLSADEVAVGVFTSALNLRERALSVQETWLRSFPKGYLIGGAHRDAELKLLSIAEAGEDYHSAHRKQFLGLLELRRRFPEAAWYFITGCDAFVFAENLLDLLGPLDPEDELLVGGHCGQVRIGELELIYPAGGPGFAISRALLEALAPAIPEFIKEWEGSFPELRSACDAAFAWLALRERGVKVSYFEGFYYGPPYYYPENTFKDGEGRDLNHPVIDKPIAFHNLSIREMYQLSKGRWPKRPGLLAKIYDKSAYYLSRRIKSRRLVNLVSRLLFG